MLALVIVDEMLFGVEVYGTVAVVVEAILEWILLFLAQYYLFS